MTAIDQPAERQSFSWFIFGLMASVTFVGILSELVPSGVLPQMTEGLGVSEAQVGFLVGVYALASAICAIPLVSATLSVNRKYLLLILLAGFAASNIVVAISSSYAIIIVFRIVGGICAGVMWPMIAAYGTRLVPPHMHGKAVTVIMAGNTLGISIGLPVMTTIGVNFGWRTEFMVLGLIVVAIGVLSYVYLPSVEGEKLTKSNSPLAVLKNPAILIILLLTFLSVAAHYGIYTYIALLLESGIGRWKEQYLAPYTFAEYLALVGVDAKVEARETLWETLAGTLLAPVRIATLETHRRRFLLTGGFPELLNLATNASDDEQTLLLQSQKVLRTDAVERAVYKDIPQTFGVSDTMLLERLLYTLAGQVCGILSPTKICQNLGGLSRATFDRYANFLERAFLIFTLLNYSGSELSKQKRGRKLYFVDGAVRNAALQRGIGPLTDAVEMGLLMENMVAGHLHALSQQSGVRLYYWRDGDNEVDLIYDHPEQPVAFEIASSGMHGRSGIEAFMQRFPRFRGRCYLVAPGVPPIAPGVDGIDTMPLDLLLLVIGAQTGKELASRLAIGGTA